MRYFFMCDLLRAYKSYLGRNGYKDYLHTLSVREEKKFWLSILPSKESK
jgi:hypothetical protein